MTAGELLDQVRDLYLNEFASAAAYFSQGGSSVVLEPALRDENGNLGFEGPLGLPMRADLVVVRNGEVENRVHVDTNKMVSFEPLSFEWPGGLEVRLAPFQWEACGFRVKGIGVPIDWAPLKKWFIRWFDTEETNSPDANGFFNVVHFLSEPELQDGVLALSVDFGTAPEEALEELIDSLRNLGAASVEIGAGGNEG